MFLQSLKKSFLFAVVGALFVFTACQGEPSERPSDRMKISQEAKETTPTTETNLNEDANSVTNDGQQPISTEQSEVVNTPSATVRINPPHGEPGHDCAVPVGDPLPSSGGNAAASPSIQMPQPIMNNPTNDNSTVMLNPPHGEPGHDCAIPVGQPLN